MATEDTDELIAEIERELGFIKATPRRLGGERAGVVVYLLERSATLLTKLAEAEATLEYIANGRDSHSDDLATAARKALGSIR